MGVGRNDFCVFIDHHAAHGVVNLRADFNAVERSLGNIEPLVERKDAVEVFVIVGFNVAVEFSDFVQKGLFGDTEGISQLFECVKLLNRTHFQRKLNEGRVDRFNNGVVADRNRIVFVGADDFEQSVGFDLTAGVFVHEAFASLSVNDQA